MEFLPLKEKLEDNMEFITHPDCVNALDMSVKFFASVGYFPPWIGYYVQVNNQLVGSVAFKGKPKNGKVEIAYGTFPEFQRRGIGAQMCHQLVTLALKTDANVIVTARTFPEESYSTRILRKNNFKCVGIVIDEDDGEVWEWEYESTSK